MFCKSYSQSNFEENTCFEQQRWMVEDMFVLTTPRKKGKMQASQNMKF